MRGSVRVLIALGLLIPALTSRPGAIPTPAAAAAPAVLGWSPEITRGLPPGGSLHLYFTRAMDPASVQAAWRLSPAAPGAFRWNGAELTWTPRLGLRTGTYYRLTIGAGARAANGAALRAPFSLTFSTGDPLVVRSFTPTNGTTRVPLNGLIAISFNHPMVPLRGIDDPLTNPAGWHVSITPHTPGYGSWLGTSTWVFHPDHGLAPSSNYSVSVAGTARDAWGEALGRTQRWTFSTVLPEVIARSPARGGRFVDPHAAVKVGFNQPMDLGATPRAFSLRAGGAPVPGRVSWQNYTLVYHPSQPLSSEKTYTATVGTTARSANGKGTLHKAVRWSFHAAPPPKFMGSDPPANGTAYDQGISIYFNTPMSQVSLDKHLRVSPALGRMYTSFYGPDPSTDRFTYVINGDFQPSTRYTVTIKSGVRDAFGRALGKALSLHISTAPSAPSLAFYGMPGAREGISFSAGRPVDAPIQAINVSRVRYTLIHTTVAALVQMQNNGPPAGKTVRSWTVTSSAPLNTIQNLGVRLVQKDGKPIPAGLYWLGADAEGKLPGLRPNAVPPSTGELVIARNLGVTMKHGGNEVLVWATSDATGQPASGLPVTLLTYAGETVASGKTDGQGIAVFKHVPTNKGDVNAMVDSSGLFGLARSLWNPVLPPLSTTPFLPSPQQGPSGNAYMYTDRPVYRPGQRVHFRAILWRDRDAVYSLPVRRTVQVTSSDNTGRQIFRATMRLDRFGAVHGSFTVRGNAPTGFGWISAWVVGTSIQTNTSFQVAEYRKPEFLTAVSADKSSYVQGQTAQITAQVSYVFGAPVANQPVRWIAYDQPRFPQPPGWDNYTFFDWQTYWQQTYNPYPSLGPGPGQQSQFGGTLAQGKGRTDGQGRLLIRLPVNLRKQLLDGTITLEATTTDVNHQSVSGRVQVTGYKSDLAIGLAPQRQTVPVGQQESIDVAAVKPDGTPIARTALTAKIFRRTYTVQFNPNAGGWSNWQSIPHDTLVETQTVSTDSGGKATVTFTPREGGEYRVSLEGKDELGNISQTAISIWASAEGFSDWGLADTTSITLTPDKSSYKVGDTAHVLVGAPFDNATALVTLERGNIRMERVQHLTSTSSTVDIPITLTDLPNVYVTVTLYHGWRGATPPDWRYGVTNLAVRVDPRHLQVRLAQSGKRHHPGDPVTYTVTTTDLQGHPVSAEVSVALVDTSVLALQTEINPDILSYLYTQRSLSVSTVSDGVLSIDHLKDKPNFPIQPVGFGGGGGGCGYVCPVAGAPALPPNGALASAPHAKASRQAAAQGVTIRQRFADTALWAGSVVTNASGQATIKVKLPDNTTTWRLDARAVSASTSVGQSRLETLATRDIVLRPVTPRFLLEGDRLQVGAVVSNTLRRAVTARVTMSSSGLTLGGAVPQTVQVPAQGERMVLWHATVPEGTRATLTFSAVPSTAGVQGDAVRLTLPVHPPLTDETVATLGQVYGDVRQYVVIPANAVPHPGALTVQVSASLTAGLGDAFTQEFTPQTGESNEDVANRVLAAASLRRLPASISGLAPQTSRRLPTIIAKGVRKLMRNQLGDGGWPWFNGQFAQSDPVITGDVLQALAASGLRGNGVGSALGHGRGYLHHVWSASYLSDSERARLLLILSLTGSAPKSLAESMYNDTVRRAHLTVSALADLGWTLARSGDRSRAASVVAALDSRAVVSATGAHWEGTSWDYFAQPAVAATTRVLAALIALSPRDAFVPAAARWLMLARQGAAWDCSPDSAQAIAALSSYALAAREGTASYRYRVMLDNRPRLIGAYTPTNQRQTHTMRFPIRSLPRRSAVTVAREAQGGAFGTGPLYYLAQLHYFLKANTIQPRDEGISVRRVYLDMKGHPITSAAAGSVVQVKLTISTSATLIYLDVEDPIPAGFEPIDESLQTSQQGLVKQPRWWFPFGTTDQLAPYLTHSDLHDDRASLYAQYLPPGTYTYTYLAAATVPGHFAVAPTHVAETFFPEVFGRSGGQSVTVR